MQESGKHMQTTMTERDRGPARRRVLQGMVALGGGVLLAACGHDGDDDDGWRRARIIRTDQQAGTAMATEAVKLITGAGDPLIGRVLVGHAGDGAAGGAGHELEAFGQGRDLVAVAHPHLQHAVAFGGVEVLDAVQQPGVARSEERRRERV